MNLFLIVLACFCASPQEVQKPTPPANANDAIKAELLAADSESYSLRSSNN